MHTHKTAIVLKVGKTLAMDSCRLIMQREKYTYYFKEESVLLKIPHSTPLGDSYISFNCYNMQSRKKFKKFSQVIQDSSDKEYTDLNSVYGLARHYGINISSANKPTITDHIAF